MLVKVWTIFYLFPDRETSCASVKAEFILVRIELHISSYHLKGRVMWLYRKGSWHHDWLIDPAVTEEFTDVSYVRGLFVRKSYGDVPLTLFKLLQSVWSTSRPSHTDYCEGSTWGRHWATALHRGHVDSEYILSISQFPFHVTYETSYWSLLVVREHLNNIEPAFQRPLTAAAHRPSIWWRGLAVCWLGRVTCIWTQSGFLSPTICFIQ